MYFSTVLAGSFTSWIFNYIHGVDMVSLIVSWLSLNIFVMLLFYLIYLRLEGNDNLDRRMVGFQRRQFTHGVHFPERRTGYDRRLPVN